MAVPKKKTSKSRTKRRYAKWAYENKKKLVNRVLPRVGRFEAEEEVTVINVDEDEKPKKKKTAEKNVDKKEPKAKKETKKKADKKKKSEDNK